MNVRTKFEPHEHVVEIGLATGKVADCIWKGKHFSTLGDNCVRFLKHFAPEF